MSLKSIRFKVFSAIVGLFWPFSLLSGALRGLDGIEICFTLSVNSFLINREVDFTFL